ncbi:MAG: hypothetical protein J5843_01625, partial [Clostridia bacterium]|nr:hypothetical protein [Clostridia bacterium]
MKKALAVILTAVLCLALVPSLSFAFGTADGTMAITHINQRNAYEGAGIIIDGAKYEKIGDLGNYAWWTVLLFDWDETDGYYKLTGMDLNSNNKDKSAMEIPRTGFAYGACVGNDYTSQGGINYKQTTRMIDSIALAKTLKIGDKAYLYGVNLANAQIKNNGKNWYAADYVTESYIKIGTPESGKTAYDPTDAASAPMQYVIETNHVNDSHYESGDCNFFDNKNGRPYEVVLNYSWWTCLVFGWDAEQDCFVCVANDKSQGNGYEKTPPIPEGGFVILDCYSSNQGAVSACVVGTKAWLYNGTGGNYKIYLNEKASSGTEIKRTAGALNKPAVQGTDESGVLRVTDGEQTIRWNAVSGATEYLVSVNTSTIHTFGPTVVHPVKMSGTSYTFSSGLLEAGQRYTVFVQALGSGKASVTAAVKVSCVRESALSSSLRDKTIVAFGDSLTARSGWVDMLEGIVGTAVVNAGVGGDSTNNGAARIQKDVLDLDPDIVLICFGMNDQAQVISGKRPNISLDTYRTNMESFVQKLQAKGADVILICPHDAYNADGYYKPGTYGLDYSFGYMEQFCEVERQIALAYGLDFIDIYTEAKQEDMSKFLNAGDGIHQSVYGHERWASYVGDYLIAKYDGTKRGEIKVQCKDRDGKLLKEYAFTAAVGARLQIPATAIDGLELVGTEQTVVCKASTEVTYLYASPSGLPNGDVNGDGEVDSVDYFMVRKYL